tara:strand:- start:174 stop:557 length:384 start_codon:yes stop_codon:yes gene_type:complete
MPSKRQMRRAYERFGEAVYEEEEVGKHSKGRKRRKQKPMSTAYKKKLRALYLRADILVIPYTEREVKDLMKKAREEYDKNGLISTATSLELMKAGQNVHEIEKLWDELKEKNININFDKNEEQKNEQ